MEFINTASRSSSYRERRTWSVFFIAALWLITTSPPAHAETSSVKETIFKWLVDGVSPQAPDNPLCASDSGYHLGHITRNAPRNWIEIPLASLCHQHANPTTGALPPLIYACYTMDAPNDHFDSPFTEQPLCFCDYYLCDPANQQPFEDAVEFVVKLADLLD